MAKYLSLFFIFFLYCFQLQSQKLRFFREDLTFSLAPRQFAVSGSYFFSNPGGDSVKMVLRYPFPADDSFGNVDSAFCFPLGHPEENKIIRSDQQSFDFMVELAAADTVVYIIGYRQKIHGNKARYILRSTASWGKGFDTANYSLLVKNLIVDSLSYIPDKVILKKKSSEYFWRKSDFMPDKDFVVFFRSGE